MIPTLAGAVLGSILVGLVLRWRTSVRQEAATDGRPFDVPVKVRLLEQSGIQGRWRDGVLHRLDGRLRFRPRRPRLARTLDLTASTVVDIRDARLSERWWFAGSSVLLTDGPAGPVEIAAGSEAHLTLAGELIRRRG